MRTQEPGVRALSWNIGATFARQIAAALLSLVSAAVVARVYGPEGNGAFAVALLLPGMLSTFLNLGVSPANVYYLGSAQIKTRTLFRANLRIFFVLATLGLLVGSVVIVWKGEQLFPDVAILVLWLALAGFPVGLLQGFLASFFQGLQQFKAYNLILMARPIVFLGLVAGMTLLGLKNIGLLVVVQITSQLIVLLITASRLKLHLGLKEVDEPLGKFFRQTLSYGWKAHLGNILSFVNYKADILLANFFVGPAAVGVYVVAVAIAEKLWLISSAVSTVLLPRLSQLSADEDQRKWLTPMASRWVLLTTFAGALFLATISGPAISLVFGDSYLDALLPLRLLMPGIVLLSASRVMANDIAARGRPELNMYIAAIVVLVNVAGNLILIPTYGISGAAIATTIAYTLDLLLRLIVYGRFTENRWSDSLIVKPSEIRLLIASLQKA